MFLIVAIATAMRNKRKLNCIVNFKKIISSEPFSLRYLTLIAIAATTCWCIESTAHSYLVVNSVLCDTMASATATSMAKKVRASSSSSMPKQRNDYGDDSSEKSEDGWRLESFM